LGEHPPTEQHRKLVGLDFVVFGFTAVNGFHVEGVAKDEGNLLLGTEISEPVPREETFDSDDDILAIGRNDLEQGVWAGLHVTRHHDLPISVQDADVHGPSVQVDPTVTVV
jgi:hypothetical protein